MEIKGGESSMVLHKKFQKLGRERNRITYKLLALLPQIYKEKVYESVGFATIYEYAGKLAGLSHSVVEKALKLEKKLEGKPYLQKMIETQGIHKVAMIAGIATEENEEELADKVENMSKPALQEYSKELRGKIQTTWQIEMDEEMMTMFLKLKKEFGNRLSNKEAMRRLLKKMSGEKMMHKNVKSQRQAHGREKIPEEISCVEKNVNDCGVSECVVSNRLKKKPATRYIPVRKKRAALSKTDHKCSHPCCCKPAEVLHHPDRFSVTHNHSNLKPLCKTHHEFAHNGITEKMHPIDYKYRKHRQAALL